MPKPSTIKWREVTWYSQLTAIFLAIGILALGFYLGKQPLSDGTQKEARVSSTLQQPVPGLYADSANYYAYVGVKKGTLHPILSRLYPDPHPLDDVRYYKDDEHVYFVYGPHTKLIYGADPATFTVDIQNNFPLVFGVDKAAAYLEGQQFLSSEGFRILQLPQAECGGSGYVVAMDQSKLGAPLAVFIFDYEGSPRRIEGADVATFVPLPTGFSKDKNYVYEGALRTSYDPATFDKEKAESFCEIG